MLHIILETLLNAKQPITCTDYTQDQIHVPCSIHVPIKYGF